MDAGRPAAGRGGADGAAARRVEAIVGLGSNNWWQRRGAGRAAGATGW